MVHTDPLKVMFVCQDRRLKFRTIAGKCFWLEVEAKRLRAAVAGRFG